VAVGLLYTDGLHVTRQAVTPAPMNDDPALQNLARTALYRGWHRRVRLRQISLACSLLQHPVLQLSLFAAIDPRQTKNRRISEACDAIRDRCGSGAILRGCQQPAVAGMQ
jgi:DNA polymerase-4